MNSSPLNRFNNYGRCKLAFDKKKGNCSSEDSHGIKMFLGKFDSVYHYTQKCYVGKACQVQSQVTRVQNSSYKVMGKWKVKASYTVRKSGHNDFGNSFALVTQVLLR